MVWREALAAEGLANCQMRGEKQEGKLRTLHEVPEVFVRPEVLRQVQEDTGQQEEMYTRNCTLTKLVVAICRIVIIVVDHAVLSER